MNIASKQEQFIHKFLFPQLLSQWLLFTHSSFFSLFFPAISLLCSMTVINSLFFVLLTVLFHFSPLCENQMKPHSSIAYQKNRQKQFSHQNQEFTQAKSGGEEEKTACTDVRRSKEFKVKPQLSVFHFGTRWSNRSENGWQVQSGSRVSLTICAALRSLWVLQKLWCCRSAELAG